MKKTKGFTLIELIVVMAIIGVLSAVLVPILVNYLTDAKLSKANANAKQVYNSAANYAIVCAKNGVKTIPDISSGQIPSVAADVDVLYDGEHLLDFLGKVFGPSNNRAGYISIKMDGRVPLRTAWVDDLRSDVVGTYPDPAEKPGESMDPDAA